MKAAKNAFFGLVVIGVIVFISGVSFAETATSAPAAAANDLSVARKAKHEARIKLLQDSAAALQMANPDLAMKLTDIVNGEAKLTKDSPEWRAKHDERVQLYKDAAAVLQATNPDLAKGLMDMTAPWQKTEMQKAAEENNKKEEAVENVEPKGDK